MGATVWRSARSQGGCGRLGGTHSVCRNAKLRPARHGEFAGLSCSFWHWHRGDVEARSAWRDYTGSRFRVAFDDPAIVFRVTNLIAISTGASSAADDGCADCVISY